MLLWIFLMVYFFELEKLSIASKIGFEFFHEIDENIGTSGEEYEILFLLMRRI